MSDINDKISLCLSSMSIEDEAQVVQMFENDDFDRDEYNVALQSYFNGTKWIPAGLESAEGYDLEDLPDISAVGRILPSYHTFHKAHGSFKDCKFHLFNPPEEANLVLVSDTMLTIMTDPEGNVLYWNIDCG